MSLEEGAKNAVATCMGVRLGERVLILSDGWKPSIPKALFSAAEAIGAEPMLMQFLPNPDARDLPPPVAKAMLASDVVLAPTQNSISHTKARLAATKAGVRIASMPGITLREMNGPMTADFEEMAANIRRIYEAIRRKKKISVSSPSGTDINLMVDGRMWITEDHGLAREKGAFTNLPAGNLFAPVIEKKGDGVIVVDGTIDNRKVSKPVELTIKKGIVKEYSGGKDVEYLERIFEEGGNRARYIGGFGMGMNPKARVTGHPLQDEISLGTAHFYIGENYSFGGRIKGSARVSALIKKATVKIGEITIIENGELVY